MDSLEKKKEIYEKVVSLLGNISDEINDCTDDILAICQGESLQDVIKAVHQAQRNAGQLSSVVNALENRVREVTGGDQMNEVAQTDEIRVKLSLDNLDELEKKLGNYIRLLEEAKTLAEELASVEIDVKVTQD